MNSLVLINYEFEDLRVNYNLRDIDSISYGKMKDFCSVDNIISNGHKLNESAIQILFNDGSAATFGKEWRIEFRTF